MRAEARPAAADRVPAERAGNTQPSDSGATVGGRFVLENRAHTSSRAEVWRARDSDGGAVAVKLGKATPDSRTRVRAEHAWLARLTHESILRPIALIDDASHTALVTEYLPGGDLVSLAGAAPRHWASASAEVAEALVYLHSRSLVHRDVKARNVLFDSGGRARLIDFGSTTEVGKPRTLGGTTAAHRYEDRGPVTLADDVFAFAVLTYELMAGRLPFGPAPESAPRAAEPPLARALRQRPGLLALERLVLATLETPARRSILEFRDVIKSVIAD